MLKGPALKEAQRELLHYFQSLMPYEHCPLRFHFDTYTSSYYVLFNHNTARPYTTIAFGTYSHTSPLMQFSPLETEHLFQTPLVMCPTSWLTQLDPLPPGPNIQSVKQLEDALLRRVVIAEQLVQLDTHYLARLWRHQAQRLRVYRRSLETPGTVFTLPGQHQTRQGPLVQPLTTLRASTNGLTVTDQRQQRVFFHYTKLQGAVCQLS